MAIDTLKLYSPYIDEKYKTFSSSLSKTDTLARIGIRVPVLRILAKTIDSDYIEIKYHEDVILKGLAIGFEKTEYSSKLAKLKTLLPYLSSWDQTDIIQSAFKPKKKDVDIAYSFFSGLLEDARTYPKRLGIVFLMSNRKLFDPIPTLEMILKEDSDEYYISMAVAWALASFITDDYSCIKYLDSLLPATRKRCEQKLRDSRRIAFS